MACRKALGVEMVVSSLLSDGWSTNGKCLIDEFVLSLPVLLLRVVLGIIYCIIRDES